MHAALEAALGELVFGQALDPNDELAVAAFIRRHGLTVGDAAALRDGELERLLVYRELVRGTLKAAMEASIPRSLARLGARFEPYFERFLAEQAPSTHYLRDVTSEFLEFCRKPWARDPELPAYLAELARHEALHVQLAAAAPEPSAEVAESFELDASLRFISAVRLMRYAFAVHELPERLEDRTEPERRATTLLAYRSPEHEVRYLELTPFAADLVERLLEGATLRAAVEATASALATRLEPSLLEATARLLADLARRGVLLGAASPSRT